MKRKTICHFVSNETSLILQHSNTMKCCHDLRPESRLAYFFRRRVYSSRIPPAWLLSSTMLFFRLIPTIKFLRGVIFFCRSTHSAGLKRSRVGSLVGAFTVQCGNGDLERICLVKKPVRIARLRFKIAIWTRRGFRRAVGGSLR